MAEAIMPINKTNLLQEKGQKCKKRLPKQTGKRTLKTLKTGHATRNAVKI